MGESLFFPVNVVAPIDSFMPAWQLKYDGFRSLAIRENGRSQLISRNGHPFNSFAELRQVISASSSSMGKTVLDGEVVCLDNVGKPQSATYSFIVPSPASTHSIC